MKPSTAILRMDFTVRNWARSCYVIRIHIAFKSIHSGERIQEVPDSPANSPDTCGQKAYPERKCCVTCGRGLNVQICHVLVAVAVVAD